MKKQRLILFLTVVLLLASLLVGCAARAQNTTLSAGSAPEVMAPGYNQVYSDDIAKEELVWDSVESPTAANNALSSSRKWIRTIRINTETSALTDFLDTLDAHVTSLGGYVESRNIYNGSKQSGSQRNASLTIRIPAENADHFLGQLRDSSNIIRQTDTMEDVTLQYVDTQSRITALETEQQRLLELLEKADSLDAILEIESRLSEVRYELERYASQLRVYDNRIDYATIYLEVQEVAVLTVVEEQNTWQRIGTGFVDTLQAVGSFFTELFVGIVVASPVLALIAIPVTVVVIILVRRKK